jgi:very-short-patch-repair endonuclease
MDEFQRESKVSPGTLVKRFGGWKQALSSAGFDPQKARLTYQDIEIMEELKRVASELRRTPSTTEFDERSSMSATTVSQRLGGSWETACQTAGLQPYLSVKPRNVVAGWNKGQRKLQINKDELQYLYEVEGLSASAIAIRLNVGRGTVLRRMDELGIPVKKLHYTMPRETAIEAKIYQELERRGVTFVKQQVIDGLWVVDALIPGARVVVECDGEYWHSLPEMVERDRKKDGYLKSRGYKVLRFPEAAIHADVVGCVQRVIDALINRFKEK